jgi:hypothetical protein
MGGERGSHGFVRELTSLPKETGAVTNSLMTPGGLQGRPPSTGRDATPVRGATAVERRRATGRACRVLRRIAIAEARMAIAVGTRRRPPRKKGTEREREGWGAQSFFRAALAFYWPRPFE